MSYAPFLTQPGTDTNQSSRERAAGKRSVKDPTMVSKGRAGTTTATPRDIRGTPIIVHCHLCWDWVWQRPQQFMSRLSEKHPILFVETTAPDPSLAGPLARFHSLENFPNITVLRLQFPAWRWHDGEWVDAERRRIVQEFASGPGAGRYTNAVQWFYDPMTVTAFAGHMGESLTVYDCMDELSKFRGAPPRILEREARLLEIAEVVFTGGRKLFEAKSQRNPNCHFYGCGVDWQHFGKASEAGTLIPEDICGLKRPVLGFFGVVDERMDYELVSALAEANPDYSIVIVGPTAKVDPNTIPRRPNLHWVGPRKYEELPAYCKGFDVCIMPFALNESTEYINPTKALEYMATGRPIVSTAVPDIVTNFGSIVKVARSHGEFIELCRQFAAVPDEGAIARGIQMAHENSWESIVARLEHHMEEALLKKRTSIEVA